MRRREFITAPAAAAAFAAPGALPVPASKLWIDPKLATLPRRPWRKIHLDFHNTEHIAKIGEKFNADDWGNQLVKANVDSIVVFAKDMHGYFYYPSKYGPVHPGLSFDLLGAQVEACRKRKIAVYAYYCTTWDHYLAARHAEWLQLRRDGANYLPKPDQTPGWTALCIAHEDFVNLMLDHTKEFIGRYALDGAWFDMPVPRDGECFCPKCVSILKERGLDPFDRKVQRNHKQELEISFLRRLHEAVTKTRPGCQLDYNGQAVFGLEDRVEFMDNIDLEALPSGANWGYYYFPLVVRYTRSFGVTTYGQTGRFKATWADFGGLKLPAQLDVELASITANTARCDIGDQMPPDGRLDPAVYHVIGKCYAKIKGLEPYLNGAVPVSEAAMIISGLPLDWPNTDAHLGFVKLLTECRIQFDVVEPDAAWERYGLVVLPDALAVDEALSTRLRAFIDQGGAVVVSNQAGVIAGTQRSWLENHGLAYAGTSPFRPAYMIPKENFTGDIPTYQYALYEGATRWKTAGAAQAIAQLGEPAFQRSPEHYTSHAQTPFDHVTEYAAIARSGRVALFGFPLGSSYFTQGYWVYRSALRHVLNQVTRPVVRTNAPVTTEIAVTHQKAAPGRRERYLVHIVNWSANRGTPRHPVFHEEPIPLTNVRVTLDLPVKSSRARAVIAAADLPVRATTAGLEVVVPLVPVHEILCIEVG